MGNRDCEVIASWPVFVRPRLATYVKRKCRIAPAATGVGELTSLMQGGFGRGKMPSDFIDRLTHNNSDSEQAFELYLLKTPFLLRWKTVLGKLGSNFFFFYKLNI